VNVRCPHCSAVFPVGAPPATGPHTVECPLCLSGFDAKAELTLTIPGAPVGAMAAPRDPEDEFEQFGLAGKVNTATFGRGAVVGSGVTAPVATAGSPQLTVPVTAAPPLDLFGGLSTGAQPPPAASSHAGDIDFDSLLSDAVQAVDRVDANHRQAAATRVTAPRAGIGTEADSLFPLPPASRGGSTALAIEGGMGMASPGAAASPSGAIDDSLFEAPGTVTTPAEDLSAPLRDSAANAPAQRRPRPQGGRGRAAKASRFTFGRAVAAALFVVGAGVGPDLAGYGLFGSKLWKSQPAPQRSARKGAAAADLGKAVPLDDSQAAYEQELARLDKLRQRDPKDDAVLTQLAAVYMDLVERFPEALGQGGLQAGWDALNKAGKLTAARVTVYEALGKGENAAAMAQLPTLQQGSADDKALATRLQLQAFRQQLVRQTLDNPGLVSAAERDPLRTSGAETAAMVQAMQLLETAQQQAKNQPNFTKFQILRATFADVMGQPAVVQQTLQPLIDTFPEHFEARLLLASAALDAGKMEDAKVHFDKLELLPQTARATPRWTYAEAQLLARRAAVRGDRSAQIEALARAVTANPADELTTIRLARLQFADKRIDDASRLLQQGKRQQNFKSIAFETAMVEYWLQVNRNDDALQEISEATKLYPESVELLYLRGQVEDKLQHSATARDYFAQVLQRQPKHLRAAVRLAELQSSANRHDEALATLQRTRDQVGDDETVLKLLAEELVTLQRDEEARQILEALLKAQPENRHYLMRAAQLDLKAGKTDVALEFLRKLREQKALDRPAAMQMALALANKKQWQEAASTVAPFADEAIADLDVNTLTGRLYLDAGELDKAQTYIQHAVQTGNGKHAASMFQSGRLAFLRKDAALGTSRIKQAITADPLASEFRVELARFLLEQGSDASARKVAMEELSTVTRSAEALKTAGRPVANLAAVHRLLARGHLAGHDFAKAVKELRTSLELQPGDAEALTQLGKALYFQHDPNAGAVLQQALGKRAQDPEASLYYGLHLVNQRKANEALGHLQAAARGESKHLAEAHYHIALIYKERNQPAPALRAVEAYLAKAAADDTYRADAESMRKTLKQLGRGGL
jgi:tetratricopeptide (TPR) repeat protein